MFFVEFVLFLKKIMMRVLLRLVFLMCFFLNVNFWFVLIVRVMSGWCCCLLSEWMMLLKLVCVLLLFLIMINGCFCVVIM